MGPWGSLINNYCFLDYFKVLRRKTEDVNNNVQIIKMKRWGDYFPERLVMDTMGMAGRRPPDPAADVGGL
jgi:hypothetical protein